MQTRGVAQGELFGPHMAQLNAAGDQGKKQGLSENQMLQLS